VGLIQIAAIIGFIIGCFGGGYLSDYIFARRLRNYHGPKEREQRLITMLPAFCIGPAGCILMAFACAQGLHWSALAFGFGMGESKFCALLERTGSLDPQLFTAPNGSRAI
jgi:MFS family permease